MKFVPSLGSILQRMRSLNLLSLI